MIPGGAATGQCRSKDRRCPQAHRLQSVGLKRVRPNNLGCPATSSDPHSGGDLTLPRLHLRIRVVRPLGLAKHCGPSSLTKQAAPFEPHPLACRQLTKPIDATVGFDLCRGCHALHWAPYSRRPAPSPSLGPCSKHSPNRGARRNTSTLGRVICHAAALPRRRGSVPDISIVG